MTHSVSSLASLFIGKLHSASGLIS